MAEVSGDAGRRFERRVLSGVDRWGALPDGSLWVARVYDNRVEWRSPDGAWTRGDPLPDRVLEVTRYDRELFIRRFPPELRNTAEQLPFAAVKPPFEAGFTSPSGQVWLEKSRAPADSCRRYHVVDRQGQLRREIRLPGQGRIVAVGDGVALVAEPSRDGDQLLDSISGSHALIARHPITRSFRMKLAPPLRALALTCLVGCGKAESQGALTLEHKLPGSFAQLSNVVELGSGRVAFADTRGKLFLIADLASGSVDTVGTRVETITAQSPPDQYKFPGWVAHLAGDTVALVDFAAQRTTLWSEEGKALKVLRHGAGRGHRAGVGVRHGRQRLQDRLSAGPGAGARRERRAGQHRGPAYRARQWQGRHGGAARRTGIR